MGYIFIYNCCNQSSLVFLHQYSVNNRARNKCYLPRWEQSGSVKVSDASRLTQLVSGMTRCPPAPAESEWFLSYSSHLHELWLSGESQSPSLPVILLIPIITPKWSLTPSPFFHDRLRILLALSFFSYSLVGFSYFMVWEGQRNTGSGPGSGCKSPWLWCAPVVT